MPKTGKELAQRLKLIFELQEKTSSTTTVPLFSLRPKHSRFRRLEDVRRYISRHYSSSYALDYREQRGEWDVYFFKALPQETVPPSQRGRHTAPYLQLKVRSRLVGVK